MPFTSKVAIIVEADVVPGKMDAFLSVIREHAALSKKEEPGCLRFEVVIPSTRDGSPVPDKVWLQELYEDEEALVHHETTDRMKALVGGRLDGLVTNMRLIHGAIDLAGP